MLFSTLSRRAAPGPRIMVAASPALLTAATVGLATSAAAQTVTLTGAVRSTPPNRPAPANDCARSVSAQGLAASLTQSYTCQITGAQGFVSAEGTSAGVLRAEAQLQPGAVTGLTVAPGQTIAVASTSRVTSSVTLLSNNPAVQAAGIGLSFTFDGAFRFEYGLTPRVPSTIRGFGSMVLLLQVEQGPDGFPGIACLSDGSCDADRATFSSTTTRISSATAIEQSVSGAVTFSQIIPVLSSTAMFTTALQANASLGNTGSSSVTYFGSAARADFSNTVRLASVQVFDAEGNDVSSAFTATLPTGATIRTGAVVVTPEPGTWALLGTGLLALGSVARRRQRTA